MKSCAYLICSLIINLLIGCTLMTETQKEREARIQSSPQSQNGTFANPNGVSSKLFSQETWEVAKDYIFTKRIDPKPLVDLPIHRLHSEKWKNKPLPLDDDRHIPDDLKMAYKILKNSGYLPPEIELKKKITQAELLLEAIQQQLLLLQNLYERFLLFHL